MILDKRISIDGNNGVISNGVVNNGVNNGVTNGVTFFSNESN